MAVSSNLEAVTATIEGSGLDLDVWAAEIAAAARLALAVDAEPSNASLWREYRAALATLRAAASHTAPVAGDATLKLLRGDRPAAG